MERDYSISLIRMISTIFIVACHMMQWADCELAWWFNVGVQIFFCMSGYLYGTKIITNEFEWYKKAFVKILIGYYITIIPVILVFKIVTPEYITLDFVLRIFLTSATIDGGTHLWFISYILFCYLLTPMLNRFLSYRYNKVGGTKLLVELTVILIILYFVLRDFTYSRFKAAWISCYILGMLFGKLHSVNDNKHYARLGKFIFALALAMNIMQILTDYTEILPHPKEDSSISAYYNVFCDYAHAFLGISLFIILKKAFMWLLSKQLDTSGIKLRKICDLTDRYSYFVYLVHQFLILGPFSLMDVTPYFLLNIAIVICGIIILTLIVEYLSNRVKKMILR